MKIVCIGDSLTYGFGVMKKHTWIEILKEQMSIDFINRGINGDTTSGMLSRSYEDVILNHPDKVIIMGGTNDFIKNYNVKRVLENIAELAEESKNHYINPLIGIEIPIEPLMALKVWSKDVDYNEVNEKIKQYRQEVINYCNSKSYRYIDFYKDFTKNLNKENESRLYTDGIHPTFEGHKIMAESAKKVLKTFI